MRKITKSILLLTSAVCLSSSQLSAVTTDPVGYVTETLRPASFNLIGVNLSGPVIVAGQLSGVSGTTLTDSNADFSGDLTDGEYFIKITSGTSELGLNTKVSVSGSTTLVTDDDLSGAVSSGVAYEIREVVTVSDLFGADNEVELQGALAGDTSGADIIWIPNGLGGFERVFYNETSSTFPPLSVGWKSIGGGNADGSEIPVYFTDAIFVQVKRSEFGSNEAGVEESDVTRKNILFAGSVQTENSQAIIESGFNRLNRVFPSELSLAESELELDITPAAAGDLTGADIIWIPDGNGGYNRYYYNGSASSFPPLSVGWKGVLTGNVDASGAMLTSGFYIQRKGAAKMVQLRVPSSASL